MSKETTSTEETKKGLVPYTEQELKQITRDAFCQYLTDVKNSEAKPIEKPCERYPDIKFPIPAIEGFRLASDERFYSIGDTSETVRVGTWNYIDYRTVLIPNGDRNYKFDPKTVDTQVTITRCAENGSEQFLLFTSNYNLIMLKGEDRANLIEFLNEKHTEIVPGEDGSVRYIAYNDSTCEDVTNPGFVEKEVFDAYETQQPVTVQESIDLHNAMVSKMVVTPEMILPTAQTPDPCM